MSAGSLPPCEEVIAYDQRADAEFELLERGMLSRPRVRGPVRHRATAPPPRPFRRSLRVSQLTANTSMPSDTPPPTRDAAPPRRAVRRESDAVVGRYHVVGELGRGGMGLVVRADDPESGRTIALKRLQDAAGARPIDVRRFLREARITAGLEHPAIIPVYELGTLADGQPYYTMRIVTHRSLADVLSAPLPRVDWPLARLCSVFIQVCRALAYAHARTVIHRDVKPENILLGEYGEVYLADWGIAKVLAEASHANERSGAEVAQPGSELDGEPSRSRTLMAADIDGEQTPPGAVLGTPGYIPPEQIRGQSEQLGPRTDVFALGAILYEMLTATRPFERDNGGATILATLEDSPLPPRQCVPSCPIVLEELCLRLLAKNADDRPSSAEVVAGEVEAYLEGVKERERRQREAVELAALARRHVERHDELRNERERLEALARDVLQHVKAWDPPPAKLEGWALQDAASRVAVEQARELAAALETFTSGLSHDPECADARSGLADLYASRAERAELDRDDAARAYNEALVRRYDDGRLARKLDADSTVSLQTEPAGALVVAYRFVEVDRVLQPRDERVLGATPLREVRLTPGSYVCVLRRDGQPDVRYPLVCRRGEHHDVTVRLRGRDEIGEQFVYVPGGLGIVGGDPHAFESMQRRETNVADFAIARDPVTFDEYLQFIDDIARVDPRLAERRLPRTETEGDEPYAERGADGRWRPRYGAIIEGDGRAFCPPAEVGRVGVMGVDWFDAVAYCRWRSERDGVPYRLPTEIEWEKAARGVDGRYFPWGDRFDASFCKMRDSRPGFPQAEPVGVFSTDRSLYGVRDLAGGMRCWAADIDSELDATTAAAEPEPGVGARRDATGMRISRGGAWLNVAEWCRSASRNRNFAQLRVPHVGVRVAKVLPSG